MLPAVGPFNRDLWYFGRRRQDEVGMIDLILAPIGHANNERLKRTGV